MVTCTWVCMYILVYLSQCVRLCVCCYLVSVVCAYACCCLYLYICALSLCVYGHRLLGAGRHLVSTTRITLLCNCQSEPVDSRHSWCARLEPFSLVLVCSSPTLNVGLFHSGNWCGLEDMPVARTSISVYQESPFRSTAQLSLNHNHVHLSYLIM